MPKLKILLINDKVLVKQWLETSINLSSLETEVLSFEKLTTEILFSTPVDIDILLVSEALSGKVINTLTKHFLPERINFPVLVLIKDFNSFNKNKHTEVTINEFPTHLVTPQILTHLISNLLKDYKKDTGLRKLAHYDTLTGATNRVLFNDRLEQAIIRSKRFKEPISLIYLDLDKFKQVNDKYGHNVGDAVLKKFVSILHKLIRASDTVARIGGDEFNILLPNANSEQAIDVAKKIFTEIDAPRSILNISLKLESSIGIVTFSGKEDSSDISIENIVEQADIAMYQAKHQGRNQYVVYTHALIEGESTKFNPVINPPTKAT